MSDIRLTGFELLQKVGQGGMGVVWKARQLSLDRIVAIKLLPPELSHKPEEVKRIMMEARTAARLKHAGIVQVYDASEENGVYFFVMEYIDGYNVGQWIQRKKTIPWKEALLAAEYVAAALDYAWQTAGMIHCDIKPENIMVDQDGTIKVSDLGLSVTRESQAGEAQTEILGTPSYMSPEQVRGDPDLDCRTDIYSLGATLYHMVTGQRMFQGVPEREIMELHLTHQVPDPVELGAVVPATVCSLLERMMIKDRQRRYADWPAVMHDLRRVQRGLMPAGKPPPEGASTVKRKRVKIRRGASEGAASGGGSSWLRWFGLALVVGLLAAAALLLPDRLAEWQRRSTAVATGGIAAGDPGTAFPSVSTVRGEAAHAFAEAVAWARQNPDRFEEAMFRFRKIMDHFADAPEAAQALEEIKRVRDRRQQSIEATWIKIKATAETSAAARQYGEAARLLETYTGRWAAQTASNRMDLARVMRQKSAEQELTRAGESKWVEWIKEGLADPLAHGKFTMGQEALAQVQAENRFENHKEDLQALGQIVQGLGSLDERVIKSFLKQTGTVVRVGLGRGEIAVRVAGLSGKKVRGRTLDGQAEVLIGYDELSGAERLARLGEPDCPEVAIALGASAALANDFDGAETCFGKAGPLLSAPLLEVLGELRTAAGSEKAETVLMRTLKAAGLAVGPYGEAAWLTAINNVALDREAAAQLAGEVDRYLEKYGKTEFAIKAAPVILTLQQRCAEMAEGKARAEAAAPVAAGEADVAAPPPDGLDTDAVVRALRERNPGVEAGDVAFVKVDGVESAGVNIVSDQMRDLSPLAHVKGLKAVWLEAHAESVALIDLKPLAGSTLCELRLKGYTVRDLSPVRGSKITRLAVPGSPLVSLMPLEGQPLTELDVSGSEIRDLTAVRGMRLDTLRIRGTKVASLSLLAGMPLRDLDASGTIIRDIATLRGMPLESLALAQTQVYDFQVLKGMNLEVLDLSGTKVRELSFCAAMPLRRLILRDTPIQDVAALKGKSLDALDLTGSQVKDLIGLEGCAIRDLSLAGTRLSQRDLAQLSQVKCQRLNLSGTGLINLSVLAGKPLTHLSIENTKVKDLSPLQGMPLVFLNCLATDVNDLSPLRGMPLQDLSTSCDLRGLREIASTLPDLRTVNGFDVRDRLGPGRGHGRGHGRGAGGNPR